MTSPRKLNDIWHFLVSPALGRAVARRPGNHRAKLGRDGTKFVAATQRPLVASASSVSFWDMCAGSAPHCATALPVRSTVLCVSGGASCPSSNRAHCRQRGLGEREEQLFLEIWREKNFLSSGASASKSGPTKQRHAFRRSRDAASATPIFSLQETENQTPSSLMRSSARSSVETPERKITASPRRSIAGVGTDGAASASASQPSYLLAPVDPATVEGASVDERRHAPPAFFQSALEPARVADTATAPDLSDPPVAVAVRFDRRVA